MADVGSIAASLGTDDGQGAPARQLTAGAARTGTSGVDAATRSGERAQLQKLAEEFESMLLLQVMRQVRQTVTSFGDDQGSGALGGDMGTMFDTVDAELSRYLGQAGGFGLSRSLTQSLGSVGTSSAATSRAKA